jgi:1-phosphatidylinositol-4-phosphate 5-kinase
MARLISVLFFIIVSSCNAQYSKDDWKCIEGNCIDGRGTKEYPDGGIEKGIWKNGKLSGQGYQFFGTTSKFVGDYYKGEFNKNGYAGNGTYYSKSENTLYVGQWRNNKPNGKGRLSWGANGMYYEGEFKDGLFDGIGTKFWGTEGQFKNNKYVGEWRNGKMNGLGKYYWASGSSYDGGWKNGVRHGKGTYTGKDGEIFIGNWYEGNCKEFDEKFSKK